LNHRRLGRTEAVVSDIGHGLWGMGGGWSGRSEAECVAALDESVAQGTTFFDTAWAYGDGKSDTLLGQLLARSKGLFAASKIPPLNRKWPADSNDAYTDVFPEAHVRDHVARISAALGQRPIDLLQLHVWDDSWTDDPAFIGTVNRLKQEGLIRWFGLSLNRWEPWNGLRAIETGVVDAVQVIYNIFDQEPEDELFPACRRLDVGVIARVPLDEGGLSGTLTRSTTFPPSDWRSRYFGPENLGPTVERAEKIKAALPPGMSLAEAALRFVLSCPDVATTIVGMRTIAHVRENARCSELGPLSSDLLAQLRAHRWDRMGADWSG
jgi:aryl-alcohol dehydrogenase-like predicted oxidoreductase